MNFNQFNNDLFVFIFQYLDPISLIYCERLAKYITNTAIQHSINQLCWRNLLQLRLNQLNIPLANISTVNNDINNNNNNNNIANFKDLFKMQYISMNKV